MSSVVAKAALVVSLATAAGLGWQVRALNAELAARPPIAVIDVAEHIAAVKAATPTMTSGAQFDVVRKKAERLAVSGYVVLDRATVIAQPKAFEVMP